MRRIMLTLTVACALLLIFRSCKRSDIPEQTPATESHDIAALQQSVAQALYTTPDKVVYNAREKQFVVEEDSYVTLEDAVLRFGDKGAAPPSGVNGTTQMAHYFLIAPPKESTIRIYVDASVPGAWKRALEDAIEHWNDAGSMVKMKRVWSASTATTIVSATYAQSSTIASAAYPDYYGNPGRRITINTYQNSLTSSKKVFAITHELGHTIGFAHTNGTAGELVEGTPQLDPNSVMNSVVRSWDGFTKNDLKAVRTIYPK
ncbi:M57 family metalloprotease [Paraflavisolibacter sp. H34]|uniref:M57 family metalloprotease n=1 Tax=Huijunlia imazamoxiresistens TaxID=3127457 RepID=UPI00301673E6